MAKPQRQPTVPHTSNNSPISTLPSEILAQIFLELVLEDWRACTIVWVRVTLVCRFWRDLALNFPTLWSYVFCISCDWVFLTLERSKSCPLNIVIWVDKLTRRNDRLMTLTILID